MSLTRNAETGQFVTRDCLNSNCDGTLVADESHGDPVWRCNGLTFYDIGGPLVACEREVARSIASLQRESETK